MTLHNEVQEKSKERNNSKISLQHFVNYKMFYRKVMVYGKLCLFTVFQVFVSPVLQLSEEFTNKPKYEVLKPFKTLPGNSIVFMFQKFSQLYTLVISVWTVSFLSNSIQRAESCRSTFIQELKKTVLYNTFVTSTLFCVSIISHCTMCLQTFSRTEQYLHLHKLETYIFWSTRAYLVVYGNHSLP